MNNLQFKLYTPYDQLTSIQADRVTDFLGKTYRQHPSSIFN